MRPDPLENRSWNVVSSHPTFVSSFVSPPPPRHAHMGFFLASPTSQSGFVWFVPLALRGRRPSEAQPNDSGPPASLHPGGPLEHPPRQHNTWLRSPIGCEHTPASQPRVGQPEMVEHHQAGLPPKWPVAVVCAFILAARAHPNMQSCRQSREDRPHLARLRWGPVRARFAQRFRVAGPAVDLAVRKSATSHGERNHVSSRSGQGGKACVE